MVIIEGTDKLKKRLVDLSSINLQIKKGAKYPITDADFYNSDVQIALSMGLIKKSSEKPNSPEKADEGRKVLCKSMHERDMSLPHLGKVLRPNEEFDLDESQLKDPHIQKAINRGMIRVIETVTPGSYTEGFLKLSSEFKKSEISKQKSKEDEAAEFAKMLETPDLETNEEIKASSVIEEEEVVKTVSPTKVIDTENPPPVKMSDIPDAKGESVVFNPTGKHIMNTMKNVTQVNEKGEIISTRKKSDENNPLIDDADDIDDILFSDKLLEIERIKSHPTLNKKEALKDLEQNGEIEFVE